MEIRCFEAAGNNEAVIFAYFSVSQQIVVFSYSSLLPVRAQNVNYFSWQVHRSLYFMKQFLVHLMLDLIWFFYIKRCIKYEKMLTNSIWRYIALKNPSHVIGAETFKATCSI